MIRHLAIMGIVLITLTLMNICAQKAEKSIGIQLWSVRDDMKKDAAATIKQLGEMGYAFVEAAGYSDGQFYGMSPEKFNKLLSSNGLSFTASHCGHPLPDKEQWEATMQWWDKCIDAHARAGVKYIVQASMDKKGYGSLADLKRYCDYFNAVGEKCNAKGIRFGYHNHDKEFEEVDGMVRYDYMLQNTDPDKVMFQLDLYWIMKGGKEATAYFEQYPKRFELWHVKDEMELGQSGKMNFEPIFKKAALAGMKDIIVEVERYNYPPLESVERSLSFLMEAPYVK
ncbi:sugar phosphate isomerase/epimerase [Carboxylicivirga sediminis]|uniref:Sugar phosphate isomerase/epimerase n=1 Tax=Carboxylicivirga sediminis TaxID=2006564 RepID=A0A941IWJ0_9BACT|nr:TIM barrel protein [Carboxylicivirga sediminis]MBR8534449.1 sugar phosphate isomerase/epimerase [Carboxylicivirga sediminis]